MESARDGLVAVTFVSHVRQEGKVIELYDESNRLRPRCECGAAAVGRAAGLRLSLFWVQCKGL